MCKSFIAPPSLCPRDANTEDLLPPPFFLEQICTHVFMLIGQRGVAMARFGMRWTLGDPGGQRSIAGVLTLARGDLMSDAVFFFFFSIISRQM